MNSRNGFQLAAFIALVLSARTTLWVPSVNASDNLNLPSGRPALSSTSPAATGKDLEMLDPRTRDNDQTIIKVDEISNGATIHVAQGQVIELTLHSTYWHVEGSSDESVVAQNANPVMMPAPAGTCPPGVGCGNVSVAFTARQPGTARISASRTVCGEALSCRPDQSSLSLTVIVD